MTSERGTVSLPEEVRRTSQRIADELGLSFSAVVTEALTGWLHARLVDAWLAEHQAEHGVFDEDELRALAAQAGVPYLAPGRGEESASAASGCARRAPRVNCSPPAGRPTPSTR